MRVMVPPFSLDRVTHELLDLSGPILTSGGEAEHVTSVLNWKPLRPEVSLSLSGGLVGPAVLPKPAAGSASLQP